MTIEAKKIKLARRILALDDEAILDAMDRLLSHTEPMQATEPNPALRYATPVQHWEGLDNLKRVLKWTPPDKERIDGLIAEADIQEPIEELLADLD